MKSCFFCFIAAVLFLIPAQTAFSLSSRAIPAKACIILNDDESILFARNSSEKLPAASTIKLMTAIVALDRLDPAALATVSNYASRTPSSRPRLRPGDELAVGDLLHMALMKSVNAAAVVLAEAAGGTEDEFVDMMNRKAEEIGACDTHFENASGLPTREKQYTTARDLTIILKKALAYPLIREIIGKKQAVVTTTAGKDLYIANTDALLWYRSDMVGGKTGFTNSARHCFVGALDTEKGMVYTAVLGAPSRSRLWKGTQMLINLSSDPEQLNSINLVEDRKIRKTGRYKHSRPKHSRKRVRRIAT
jgi:D-alanyl-D-alanine carboxypeptidase (penicillin-binding protein 5/6)